MADNEKNNGRRVRSRYSEDMNEAVKQAAKEFQSTVGRTFRDIEARERKMQELMVNRQRTQDEAVREHIDTLIEEHQNAVEEAMKELRSGASSYWEDMSKAERKVFMKRLKSVQELQDTISDAMRRIHTDVEDSLEDIDQSFSETLDSWSEQMREWGDSFNLSAIQNAMQDTVDSYVKNLREMRSKTGSWFDEKGFNASTKGMVDQLSSYSFNAASEYISTMMKSLSLKSVEEATNYANQMAAASKVWELSSEEMQNFVWRDIDGNGELIDVATNIASALEDNQELYVDGAEIMRKMNESMGYVAVFAGKDEKRQKKLLKSVSALEALRESEATEGMDQMVDLMSNWQKMTGFELQSDEQFQNIVSQFTGLNGWQAREMFDAGQAPELIEMVVAGIRDRMGDSEAGMKYVADSLGLQFSYQVDELINSLESGELHDNIVQSSQSIEDAFSATDSGEKLIYNKENETVGAVEEFKNKVSSMLSPITNFFAEADISMGDIADVLVVGSSIVKGLGGLTKVLGGTAIGAKLTGLLSKIPGIGSIFSGAAAGGTAAAGGAAGASGAAGAAGAGGLGAGLATAAKFAPGVSQVALGGYGIYEGIDAANSFKREADEGNTGRAAAYGVDTALLVGGGATAVGAGAASIASAAGLIGASASIPVVGWVAAGVLAVGLATKAILDNTKKTNGFAEGIADLEQSYRDSMNKTMSAQTKELASIKEFTMTSNGSAEDIEKAKQLLVQKGVNPEIAARLNTIEALQDFTQGLINASQSAQDYANTQVTENIQEAVDELKYQFDDDKRQAFIDAAVADVMGGKDVKEGTAEWDKVNRFLGALADTMQEGEEKDAFVEMYKEAMTNHGGLSVDEMKGLLGDKGLGASWRAFWSTNLDLQKSYFDNATDYTGYNAIVDTYLGGDKDLRIDTKKIDALTDETFSTLSAEALGLYNTWSQLEDKNSDVAQQLVYQYQQAFEELQGLQAYQDSGKAYQFASAAKDMGLEYNEEDLKSEIVNAIEMIPQPTFVVESQGTFDIDPNQFANPTESLGPSIWDVDPDAVNISFAQGLSEVPNDGFAYIHKGEAILTEDQANTVRTPADGGIDVVDILKQWMTKTGYELQQDEQFLKYTSGTGLTGFDVREMFDTGRASDLAEQIFGVVDSKAEDTLSTVQQKLGLDSVFNLEDLVGSYSSDNSGSENVQEAVLDIRDYLSQMFENDITAVEEEQENEKELVKEFKKNGIFGKFMSNLKSGSFSKTLMKGIFGSSNSSKVTQTIKSFFGGTGSSSSGGILGNILGKITNFFTGGSSSGAGSYVSGSSGSSGSSGGTQTFSSEATDFAAWISDMTSSHEGSYGSINYNDNGAVSVGKMQWHGGNAKNLLNMIKDADPTAFESIINQYGASDFAQSLASSDDWKHHIVSQGSSEANAIKALLESSVGQTIQEQQRVAFAQNYIDRAKSFGLTDPRAIAYIADMYNQYGMYSDLINNTIIPKALQMGGTLEAVYQATLSSTTKYLTRRGQIYDQLVNADLSGITSYDVGTPWVPEDQVALIHEGEAIIPADANPLNEPVVPDYSGPEGDNDDVVDALQWTVSRLEAKLDKLIDTVASMGSKRTIRRPEEVQKVFAPIKTGLV